MAGGVLLSASWSAQAATLRLWKGVKVLTQSQSVLADRLSRRIIPRALEAGGGKGLSAYIPVVLPENPTGIDAIVLAVYDSEEAYQGLRKNPEWNQVAQLYFSDFSSDFSRSFNALPFLGSVNLDQAYEVFFGSPSWSSGQVRIRVTQRAPGLSGSSYLETLNRSLKLLQTERPEGLENWVILVSMDYFVELELWKNDTPGPEAFSPEFQKLRKPLGNQIFDAWAKLTLPGQRLGVGQAAHYKF